MSRCALTVVTLLLGFIPVITGLIGLLGLRDPLYVAFGVVPNVPLDSNLRFFSGLWLGLGLAVFWVAPRVAEQTVLFRVLWLAIFLGGVGRLISLFDAGAPPAPFFGVLALELVGAPVFVWWQSRVANEASAPTS